ncbi:MAG: serine/threonine-protein kinase, partial [Myxococcota bacterium]|nr:serine/threonine-protein kinase [Myxococcota bacterium]
MSGTSGAAEIGHGTRIGRFIVEGQLGAGGMGVVYTAHDRELDRRVALKVLRTAAAADDAQRTRMLREGQAMARVTHPNVITVHEVGIESGIVFLAQELLDGGTLGEWLLHQPRSRAEILEKFTAAGRGLAAAHAAGLVHRDFKPDNVLLGKDGRVRVADFGLARALEATDSVIATTRDGRRAYVDSLAETAADLGKSPMAPMTQTGAVMGTPLYMAPEQHNGEPADERSDQFSFCVALYEALYGDPPFAGQTVVALADAVIHGRVEPPTKGSRVPGRLRRILLRGLRPAPADRYPSMDALLAELAHDPGRRVRRFALVAGLVALVGGAVVGGYVLRSRDGAAEVAGRRTVAVLGFQNLGGEAANAWLSSALSELLVTELAGADDLRVTSAADAASARTELAPAASASFTPETLQKLRTRLGADTIITGSYRVAGGELTLTATVDDHRRGRVKQLEVKGTTADLPGLAALAGPQIRAALGMAAPAETRIVHAVLPRDPEAARAYIEGTAALRANDFRTAQQQLAVATRQEPEFAPGHVALGQAHQGLFDGAAAHAAARKALASLTTLPIDQQLLVGGQAHELLGDLDEARTHYRRLVALQPAHLEYGLALLRVQPASDVPATIVALRKLPSPAGDDPRIDAREAEVELLAGR